MRICPKCSNNGYTKDGLVNGKQRYKCKSCNYRYTVEQRGFSSDVKRQAVILYLQGVDFRSIGHILHCSHVTVHNWIKSYGQNIQKIRSTESIKWTSKPNLNKHLNLRKSTEVSLLLIDLTNSSSSWLYVSKKGLATKPPTSSQMDK